MPTAVADWLRTLDAGITSTAADAPFMFYGTDWLAFGHLMIASLLVPLWAAAFGALRGIPIWWRFVDASFGVGAFIPSWLCWRWTAVLEKEADA